jgi:hypothetical protein
MTKILTALIAAATLATATAAVPATAQERCVGCGIGAPEYPIAPPGYVYYPVSLLKTRFEHIDGVVRQGSDTQQCSRSARSAVYKARPSQAKRASAPHCNRSRISQEFVAGAPR